MNRLILIAVVSAGLAAAASQPLAQTMGAEGGPQPGYSTHRPPHEQRAFHSMTERVEARLAYLKTALKITDAQLPQWNAFAETQRKHAREGDERMQTHRVRMEERGKEAQPTAVERLEFRQTMLAGAAARLNETLAVVKPLYAALTPEQRQTADELLARGGFHHRGGHHGRA